MSAKNYIITHYPVTSGYLAKFQEKIGERPQQVVISNVTAKGYIEIVKYLRSIKADTLYLTVMDDASRAILPLIKLLSYIPTAQKRLEVDNDFTIRNIELKEIFNIVIQISVDVVSGSLILLADYLSIRRLLVAPRINVSRSGLKRVLYLKTNLWLGVQAGGSIAHTNGVIRAFLKKDYGVDMLTTEEPIALSSDAKLNIMRVTPPRNYIIPREINHARHNTQVRREVRKIWPARYDFIYQRLSRENLAGIFISRGWSTLNE